MSDVCIAPISPRPGDMDAKTGRFVLGNSGIGGRPKGSRNKLAEQMIDDLFDHWKVHGIKAIQACCKADPAAYLKIVAMIVSKAEAATVDNELRDAAVEAFIEARRQRAVLQIERMRSVSELAQESKQA